MPTRYYLVIILSRIDSVCMAMASFNVGVYFGVVTNLCKYHPTKNPSIKDIAIKQYTKIKELPIVINCHLLSSNSYRTSKEEAVIKLSLYNCSISFCFVTSFANSFAKLCKLVTSIPLILYAERFNTYPSAVL